MKKALLLSALLSLAAACVRVQPPQAGFAADLQHFASELPARHKNLFAKISRDEFDRRIGELGQQLDTLSEEEFVTALMQVAAAVGDEHTRVLPRDFFDYAVPVGFEVFDEGIFATSVPAPHPELLTARLLAVGSVPVPLLVARMRTLIPSANESFLEANLPYYLSNTFLLRGLGIAPSTAQADFTFETVAGDTLTLAFAPDPKAARIRPTQLDRMTAHRGRGNYSLSYGPKSRLLYFNYRNCREDTRMPFATFAEMLFDTIAVKKPEKLVVDLRQNGGGNSRVIGPFLEKLARSPLRRPGRLFVLIGPRTFSSALLNAVTLKRDYDAMLVGAPTGGSPNHYGEVRSFTLPATGAEVFYSTNYFVTWEGYDGPLRPDIPVGRSVEAFRQGRDPALDSIRRRRPGPCTRSGGERATGTQVPVKILFLQAVPPTRSTTKRKLQIILCSTISHRATSASAAKRTSGPCWKPSASRRSTN